MKPNPLRLTAKNIHSFRTTLTYVQEDITILTHVQDLLLELLHNTERAFRREKEKIDKERLGEVFYRLKHLQQTKESMTAKLASVLSALSAAERKEVENIIRENYND